LPTSYTLDDQLVDAAFLSDVDEVRLLLQQGADPDTRDDEQRTPLMYVTQDCHHELVRILLEAGADPNLRDEDGWTALDLAVYRRAPDIAWLLVHYGADVNAQDDLGRSVLLRAVLVSGGSSDMLDLLRRWGARDPVLTPAASPIARAFGLSLDQPSGPGAQ
jgi:uncharacterized protein